ncbi:YhgE/Pip domain-containing protein [Gorillibacterium massiliense]|uniref:YhgE/Pip domain-containing protein n=1 Tax=Gorillibacterium massiliense TaxID=1280390 RepID=UPI0004B734F6|nr:ABC transporter permease [Gorillibacterium massiliense]
MKAYLKNKAVMGGVFMMIFYQIIMIVIFMSGYSAIPKNVPDLKIAIVNEDTQYGAQLIEGIKGKLPFETVAEKSLEQAKQDLNDRKISFLLHIPKDFTEKLSQQGEQVKLEYFINQSNPASVVSTMQNVATQITDGIKTQLETQSIQGVLQNMKLPEEQAKQLAEGITTKLSSNVVLTNQTPAGMHNQMAPMFLTMANYVGAMIYSMMSVTALNQIKKKTGKWNAFLSLQGFNVLLALIAPLVGVSIYFGFQGYGVEAFFQVWLTHALEMFTAIEFTSIFCFLFGQAGMILNMPVLLSQTIAGGAVLPRAMMPGFFKVISYISPMYYTIQIDFNTLFGGGKTGEYLLALGIIAISALAINAVVHFFNGGRGLKAETAMEKGTALEPSFM